MNSFLAAAPAADATDPATCRAVSNDGWFPDIDIAAMREAARLDGTVTNARLINAIVAAILHVNGQLRLWRQSQQALGHARLAAVPAAVIADQSAPVALYHRAVHCTAKADLMERYRDFDTTAEGNKKADQLTAPIDEQRRNAQWAIADIEGRPHVTVELI